MFAGKTVVHVLAAELPPDFESVPGNLEDVYFSTLYAKNSNGKTFKGGSYAYVKHAN